MKNFFTIYLQTISMYNNRPLLALYLSAAATLSISASTRFLLVLWCAHTARRLLQRVWPALCRESRDKRPTFFGPVFLSLALERTKVGSTSYSFSPFLCSRARARAHHVGINIPVYSRRVS